jgi:hypothetical protein
MIGHDGKPMTPEQIELSRLTKFEATLKQENAQFKKAIDALEARVAKLESKNLAADRKAGHDADGNLTTLG